VGGGVNRATPHAYLKAGAEILVLVAQEGVAAGQLQQGLHHQAAPPLHLESLQAVQQEGGGLDGPPLAAQVEGGQVAADKAGGANAAHVLVGGDGGLGHLQEVSLEGGAGGERFLQPLSGVGLVVGQLQVHVLM